MRSAPPAFPTISSIARHLISEARGRTGFRTVVVGEAAATCAVDAAIDLARRLAEQGRHAILVDWRGYDAGTFGQAPELGITEVLLGRVSFEEAVGRLPNSNAHRIGARASAEGAAVSKDKDRVNMLFDALAEAYDHIVIGGANEAVGELIATIEGNIDATVVAGGEEGSHHDGSLLGFDAAPLNLIRHVPTRARHDVGYRDNLEVAYPIFKRHNLPFAVYVCTDFADGCGDLWWLALEKAIARADSLCLRIDGSERRWRTSNVAEKDAAFHAIYRWLRGIKKEHARAFVAELCQATDFDPSGLCAAMVMTWEEIRRLAADPLVTIGAHTRRHVALAKLTLSEARDGIAQSLERIERELRVPCRHLSYPYGDERSAGQREFELASKLGMRTAVTTRKGLIQRRHASALTALPRVSLNGDYQHPRYVKVFLNGAPFAFANRKRPPAAQMAPFH